MKEKCSNTLRTPCFLYREKCEIEKNAKANELGLKSLFNSPKTLGGLTATFAAAAFLGAAATANAQPIATADIVLLVDESVSMAGEHAWINDMVLSLDAALITAGVTGNRYGLVGYVEPNGPHPGLPPGTCGDPLTGQGNPARCPGPHKHEVGGADFGTAAELATAAGTLSIQGSSIEDGMEAIDYALANYVFRADAGVNLILITDENMEGVSPTDPATNQANLAANNALLNVVVGGVANVQFKDPFLNDLLGVDADSIGYAADGSGGFTSIAGSTVTGVGGRGLDVVNEYVSSAFDSGGAAWDIDQLRAGGLSAESFTKAFIDTKVAEISTPVPEPTTLALMGLGLAGIGCRRHRSTRRITRIVDPQTKHRPCTVGRDGGY